MNKSTAYTCHNCDGSGIIRAFSHIDNGICYTCEGTGTVSTRPACDDQGLGLCPCEGTVSWEWDDCGIGVEGLKSKGKRDRRGTLQLAANILANISSLRTFKGRRWAVIHFATCCWAAGGAAPVSRGLLAVERELGAEMMEGYTFAIEQLRKL